MSQKTWDSTQVALWLLALCLNRVYTYTLCAVYMLMIFYMIIAIAWKTYNHKYG